MALRPLEALQTLFSTFQSRGTGKKTGSSYKQQEGDARIVLWMGTAWGDFAGLVRATLESWAGSLVGAPGRDPEQGPPTAQPRKRGNARRPAGHAAQGMGRGAGNPMKPRSPPGG